MGINILALDATVEDRRYDEKTGKTIVKEVNPLVEAQKLGIGCKPMPEDILLYERKTKSGPKKVFLHEEACYAFARVEHGRFLNSFSGQRLDRIQLLDMDDLKEIALIFKGEKKRG